MAARTEQKNVIRTHQVSTTFPKIHGWVLYGEVKNDVGTFPIILNGLSQAADLTIGVLLTDDNDWTLVD